MSRWLLALGLTASGCSFSLSGPDPHRPRNQPPTCDTGKGAVALDSVIAIGFGIGGIAAAGSNNGGAAILPLALGAVFAGAALHGNSVTNACRKELEDYHLVTRAPLPEDERPRARMRAPGADPDENAEPRPAPRMRPPVAPSPATVVSDPTPPAPVALAPTATPAVAPRTPAAPRPTPAAAPPPGADHDPWRDFWQEAP